MIKLVRPLVFGDDTPAPKARDKHTRDAGDDADAPVRVLVIDDDADILEHLSDALNSPFYDVRATSDVDEFYRLVDEFNPKVVITDLAMPAHDGMDVLRSFRGRDFSGEIILMSGTGGHVLEAARRMASSYGLSIAGILRKPFTSKELLALLERHKATGGTEGAVNGALLDRKIRPYFQPKIDLKTGKIVGAEALSRWLHPQRGVLMPQGYLKSVRSTTRQCVHDYTILERATEFCAKLNTMGQRLSFAVNFSADVILSNEFLDILTDVQRRHGVAPEQLIVELTEEAAVENYEELAERLLKLRLFGAQLSIDDFGTGHSSLSRIQHLPASEIKIDRSFVSGLSDYSDNLAIVRSIVDLAHSLHCQVVAEGVETVDTLDMLIKAGCDMAQGHLFSPAVNESTFLALVRDNASQLSADDTVD